MSVFALVFSVVLGGSPSFKPSELVPKIRAAYRSDGDLSASFAQLYVDKLRGKQRTETGKLWVKRDGLVRWSYLKPEPKDFVFDGTTAYFYEPGNAQVTVFERFQDSPLWQAMRLLWGQGTLEKSFDIGPCTQACEDVKPGLAVLELRPKQPQPSVDRILLLVDLKSYFVRSSTTFDALGNRTEYRFSDVRIGVRVSPQKFEFKIPKGVNVLHAPQKS